MTETFSQILHSFFSKLCIGYGMFIIFISIAKLFVKSSLKSRINNAIKLASQLIVYLSTAFIVPYFIGFIYVHFVDDNPFPINRATGSYAWAYWMMTLRPLVLFFIALLFLVKRIKSSSKTIFFISLLFFFIALLDGRLFERFVIMVTSFHRDYLPGGKIITDEILTYGLFFLLYFIEAVVIFSGVLILYWFIKKKRSERFLSN